MLAPQYGCDCDRVIGLYRRGGREGTTVSSKRLAKKHGARVVVVSTGDRRRCCANKAALTTPRLRNTSKSTAKQVLLLIGQCHRVFAMAQREIGLARGDAPTATGLSASVFSELPQLLERARPRLAARGHNRALYVLVTGDEHERTESRDCGCAASWTGHLFWIDARNRGRFPAIDLQKSLSRMRRGCHSPAGV